MGAFLTLEVTGADTVAKGVVALMDAMKDLRPFWKDVFAPKYFGIVQDLFRTGGAARGTGGKFKGGNWARLTPKYRVWKEEHYPNQPLLVRGGDLRESLRWSGAPGPGGMFEATPSYAIAGTRVPYGKYHQSGTSKMVARPFLPPPDPAVFAPLLKDWLLKTSKKA